MNLNTNQIRKTIVLRAPRHEVWHALSEAKFFGEWFGVNLTGSFTPGARIGGKITHIGYENFPFEITIERVVPESLLSWRWHPNTNDPQKDYSSEPMTRVEFHLAEVPGGTELTVEETGFDLLPPIRRQEAYQSNEKGWTRQVDVLKRYLEKAA